MSSVIYNNWDPCEGSVNGVIQPSGPPCPTSMAFDMNEYCYAVSKAPADGQWKTGKGFSSKDVCGF